MGHTQKAEQFSDEIIRKSHPKQILKELNKTPDAKKTSEQHLVKLYCLQQTKNKDQKKYLIKIKSLPSHLPETTLSVCQKIKGEINTIAMLDLLETLPLDYLTSFNYGFMFYNLLKNIELPHRKLDFIERVTLEILLNCNELLRQALTMSEKIIRERSNKFHIDFESKLIMETMKKGFIPLEKFEKSYNIRRKELFKKVIDSKECSSSEAELIFCFAIQQYHKEYCSYIDKQESDTISSIKSLFETKINANEEISHLSLYLILYCMYESPKTIKGIESTPRSNIPDYLNTILHICIDSDKYLDIIQEKITSLTNIDDAASKVVQQQYEENPYPRWHSVNNIATTNLQQYLQLYKIDKASQIADKVSKQPEVLIAGCGTGQHPIFTAQALPYAKITAIDLSKRSIAYAVNKSEQHNIKNINYYHADILKLPETSKRFDMIQCNGVLHHMESPEKGLKALLSILNDHGVMSIAVYSTMARKRISEHREAIRQQALEPTLENIRRYRSECIKEESDSIMNSRDFFSTSECRDLLFHTHEKTYTWLEIGSMMDLNNLKILAIDLPLTARAQYSKINPDDKNMTNIKHMHNFELEFPETFTSMLVFWCKKIIQ